MFIWYFSREKLIGIGGLNEDPYTENNKIGRVRRFYIAKEYRRKGVGRLLLLRILSDAKNILILLSCIQIQNRETNFILQVDL